TLATTAAPASAGATACPAPIVAITLSPVLATVQAHGGTIAFSVSVANATDTGVLWYVNDAAGGNATVGTISTTGFYTAPASAPAAGSVTIKAVPAADASRFAAARVTITAAPVGAGGGSGGSGGGGGGGGGGTLDPVALLALLAARVAHLSRRPQQRGSEAAR
ncbi:MAG TPA: hypothetical protein PK163_07320, partial [Steroidobacteraceae bacterium]|nr:hypothetical protein [Steroidobacteraceae bacterium]